MTDPINSTELLLAAAGLLAKGIQRERSGQSECAVACARLAQVHINMVEVIRSTLK